MAGYPPAYYTTDHPTTGHQVFAKSREVFRPRDTGKSNFKQLHISLLQAHLCKYPCVSCLSLDHYEIVENYKYC